MLTIGMAGTAKNTGKTTAATALLAQAFRHGITTGLTSIGLDGENLDNVTGLPKPRFVVAAGTRVAVAAGCLPVSEAVVEVTVATGVRTPLGEVLIGVVRHAGRLVLAGPNKRSELRRTLDRLQEASCRLALVDGALNRMVPLVETDALILSTGAARSREAAVLAEETGVIAAALNLPAVLPGPPSAGIVLGDGDPTRASLLDPAQVRVTLGRVTRDVSYISIPGIVEGGCLAALMEGLRPHAGGMTLVFGSALHLLVSCAPQTLHRLLTTWGEAGGRVAVCRRPDLLAVTVNPFYPDVDGQVVRPAYVDAMALEQALRQKVKVPVVDVVRSGTEALWRPVESRLAREWGWSPVRRGRGRWSRRC